MSAEEEPRALNIDLDKHEMTTRVGRHAPSEATVIARCPVHDDQPFNYNQAMDAYYCEMYYWGSDEGFRKGADCDSVILAADMAEDPDGGHVRHRKTMEEVTDEEWGLRENAAELKHQLTKRSEPTPPPGWKG